MKRRDFIAGLGGAATWPLAARAQVAGKVWRIGVLGGARLSILAENYSGFQQGMRELGYFEGRDFVTELRSADNSYDRLNGLAVELARLNVDILLTGTPAAVRPLQEATRTIPIIFAGVGDPVGSGFVASLARPGGNTTGLANSYVDTAPKQLELLLTTILHPSRIGLLGNPDTPNYLPTVKNVRAAAQQAGVDLISLEARNTSEIEEAFAALAREHVQGVFVGPDAVYFGQRRLLTDNALKLRLPTMFPAREFAVDGGLMSYGQSVSEFYHQAAIFVHKIMHGAKPADLPVEQPTRFHLTINRKTADALGVTIPPVLYIFADEVIE
jgi:putative tryptophan/tyrosine transport system substrate-binding protein